MRETISKNQRRQKSRLINCKLIPGLILALTVLNFNFKLHFIKMININKSADCFYIIRRENGWN